MMTLNKLIEAIGETKNYQQALELVEAEFPGKGDAWVVEKTKAILDLMMETA